MKIRNLFLFCLISTLFLSCSDNSDDIGGDGSNKEQAYFSLGFSFPTSQGNLRTTIDEDGDGYQQGLSTEQKFQTVAVILADPSYKVTELLMYSATDFAPDGNSAGDNNGTVTDPSTATRTYFSKTPRIVTKGDAYVYVFLNPTTEITQKLAAGTTINPTLMQEITYLTSSDITTSYAKDDNFLMGNATIPTLATIDGTQKDPTTVSVAVERFAVKLVENTATTSFDIQHKLNATTIKASFVSFNYNNLNKRAYFLKQVQQRNDVSAYPGEYVVDPNFLDSEYLPFAPKAPWYGNDFFTIGNSDVNKPFATTPQISYCLENTMTSYEQYTNRSTTIVYKAALSVNGGANATFYTYKNNIFLSYAALEQVYNADYPNNPNALQKLFTEQEVTAAYASGDPTTIQNLNIKLVDVDIKCFYNGECYYSWPIKHWEQEVLLGRMEFAVVRNNVYYLNVKSVLNIGDPWVPGGPEDPDPGTKPDEEPYAYLSVEIAVLPWIVRNNDIEF